MSDHQKNQSVRKLSAQVAQQVLESFWFLLRDCDRHLREERLLLHSPQGKSKRYIQESLNRATGLTESEHLFEKGRQTPSETGELILMLIMRLIVLIYMESMGLIAQVDDENLGDHSMELKAGLWDVFAELEGQFADDPSCDWSAHNRPGESEEGQWAWDQITQIFEGHSYQ